MLSDDVIYELDDGTLVDLSSVYYITPVKFYKARTAIAYIFSEDEGIDCSRDVYNFEIHSNNDVVMFVNHYSKKAADNSRDKLRKAWKKMKCQFINMNAKNVESLLKFYKNSVMNH
jgi:hypothetical protein